MDETGTQNKDDRKKPRATTLNKATRLARRLAEKPQRKSQETVVFDPATLTVAIDSALACYRLLVREAELTLSCCQKNGASPKVHEAVREIMHRYQNKATVMETNKSYWQIYEKTFFASEVSSSADGRQISQPTDKTRKPVVTRRLNGEVTDEDLNGMLIAFRDESELLEDLALALFDMRWNRSGATAFIVELVDLMKNELDGGQNVLSLEEFLRRKGKT